MKLDYEVCEITNTMGELSSHYPSTVLIPEFENPPPNSTTPAPRPQTIYENLYDAVKLRDLINKARFAR